MSGVPPCPDYRVTYDARLVEEAVLRAEAGLGPAEREAFRSERDPVYEVTEREERDARFEDLHGRWFVRLGLDRALHQALAERSELLHRSRACRVLEAGSGKDERADVVMETGQTEPTVVVHLRPEALLDSQSLRTLLRHELSHVADVLDPRFGYRRELPRSEGAALASALRERYRVVWDTTIDGRLARRGWLPPTVREARFAEFAQAFPMLGDDVREAFLTWYERDDPTHAEIAAFVVGPRGGDQPSAAGTSAAGAGPLGEERRAPGRCCGSPSTG